MKISWNIPLLNLRLLMNDVHIWCAYLDMIGNNIQILKEVLSIEEMRKAESFRYERDRNQFISARGILRLILAGYVGIEPGALCFDYEKDGKPRLLKESGRADIQFNLSHSEGLALYVFTRSHEAGIDLERIRNFPEMEQIVEQFFSTKERALFVTLPSSEKKEKFFNWWTRKEALMKAMGKGLTYPLNSFDLLAADGKSTESIKTLRYDNEQTRWSIWDVSPAEDFAGAVVVEAGEWNVQYWQWLEKCCKRRVQYYNHSGPSS